MVKIVNGEIVADDDPRARNVRSSNTQNSNPGSGARQGGISGLGGGSAASGSFAQTNSNSGAGKKGNIHGAGPTPSSTRTDGFSENVVEGDLARALGIYGKRVDILGVDLPMVYALLIGAIGLLWATGQKQILQVGVLVFIVYVVGCQISIMRKNGVSLKDIIQGNAGKGPAGADGKHGDPVDHKNDFGGAKPFRKPGDKKW